MGIPRAVAGLVAGIALLAMPPPSRAEPARIYGAPITISQFSQMCGPEFRSRDSHGPCEAYVVGFLESAGLLEYVTKTGPRYCLPVEVSPRSLVDRLQLVAGSTKPEERNFPVARLLRALLEELHPCPES